MKNVKSKKKKIVTKVGKKIAKNKSAKRVNKPSSARTSPGKLIGTVTHFYTAIKVAIVKFKKPVGIGARVRFRGATTDFETTLKSMQYNHQPITRAPKGKQIGIKVEKRVREGDEVFAS